MFLTTDDVAKILGITRANLYARAKSNNAPKGFLSGGRRMYRADNVEQWIHADHDDAVREHSQRMTRLTKIMGKQR